MKLSINKIYYFVTLVLTLLVLFVTNENSFAQEGPAVKISKVYDTPVLDISDDLSVETQVAILEDGLIDMKIGLAYTAPVQVIEHQLGQESQGEEPGVESVEVGEEVVDQTQEMNSTAEIESVIEVEKTEVLVPLSDVQLTYELNNGFKVVEDSVSAQLPSGEVIEMDVQINDQTLVLSPKREITESIQLSFQVEVQPDVLAGDITLTNSAILTYKQNDNLTEADLLTPTLNIIHVDNNQNILENQPDSEEVVTNESEQPLEDESTPEEVITDGSEQPSEDESTLEEVITDGSEQPLEDELTPEEVITDGSEQPSEDESTLEEVITDTNEQLSEEQITLKEENSLESIVYDNTFLSNSVDEVDKTPGTLDKYNKDAKYDPETNRIQINFNVQGSKASEEKPADILLVVDTSKSMEPVSYTHLTLPTICSV